MTNVYPQEVAKFTAMAQDWWNTQGPMRSLHAINPLRLQFIQEKLDPAGKHILDLGCGGGILTEAIGYLGAKVTGIDMSEAVIEVAKQHQANSQLAIDYKVSSAEDFAKQHPQQFDAITCLEMLEHVPDPKAIIKACAQMLKPEGKLFFSTLNRNLKSFLLAILGAEYCLKLLPKGTHQYAQFIKPSELAAWLYQENLEITDLRGITYHPLIRNFRLSHDSSVNYLAYCTFI